MNISCWIVAMSLLGQVESSASPLKWGHLAPLPDKQGFAGMYAGVSGGSLIVAGGANFPEKFPWEGGTKKWYDTIFILDQPNGTWRIADQKLPRPLGYGVSVTWNESLICIGGSDINRHYTEVFSMRLENGKVTFHLLPSLPQPCSGMCGCLVGSRIFIAGGTSSPDAVEAMRTFWCLDLSAPSASQRWEVLEPWPGPDRSHAVAAALNGDFYLISGFRWKADDKGKPQRLTPCQTDAYCYTPMTTTTGTWKRLAELPRALGAAPTPALSIEPNQIYLIGGIDHTVDIPDRPTHPGFSTEIHCYDAKSNTWSLSGNMPAGASRVALPSAVWRDRYLVVSGERAPGRRSPEIFSISSK